MKSGGDTLRRVGGIINVGLGDFHFHSDQIKSNVCNYVCCSDILYNSASHHSLFISLPILFDLE